MARQRICHELHNHIWIFGIVLPWAPESPNKYSSPTSSVLTTSLIRGLKHTTARNTNLYWALCFHFKLRKENANKSILCWSKKPASNAYWNYSKSFCVELSNDYGYTIPSFVKNVWLFSQRRLQCKASQQNNCWRKCKQLLPLNINDWILVHSVSFQNVRLTYMWYESIT